MGLQDAVAFAGHQVHVCRYREARRLLRWLGDVRGRRVLDVAGGDGYWAGQVRRLGGAVVSIDLARDKMRRGQTLRHAPVLVAANALRLPFATASFDAVMSICAIEHFGDGAKALEEMARVTRPGGTLVLSADALTRAHRWPELASAHRRRFSVVDTFSHQQLARLLDEHGFELVDHEYQFRSTAAERLYLTLSARGGRFGFNAAAPLAVAVALSDRRQPNEAGSVLLVKARRRHRR